MWKTPLMEKSKPGDVATDKVQTCLSYPLYKQDSVIKSVESSQKDKPFTPHWHNVGKTL